MMDLFLWVLTYSFCAVVIAVAFSIVSWIVVNTIYEFRKSL